MSSTASRMALRVGIWIVLPSLLACLFSSSLVPPDKVYKDWLAPFLSFSTDGRNLASSKVTSFDQGNGSGTNDPILTPTCEDRFLKLLGLGSSSSSSSFTTTNNNHNSNENTFQNISFMMHRNGEGTPCGMTNANGGGGFLDELRRQYKTFRTNMDCPTELGKYEVEALLTKTFHAMLTTSCLSVEKDGNKKAGFLGYCDMGPHKTPIQLDHGELVPIAVGNSSGETFLPCHFHTREGVRITKLHQLTELVQAPSTVSRLPSSTTQHCAGGDETTNGTATATSETCETDPENLKRHLYAVPAGRVFMFVANYVGEIIQLPHVEGANKNNIYLEVLSTDPRVFDVFNFFSREESKELVDRAIAETKESHRIKRSSTGASGHNLNSRRTSESGFDTHGKTAVKIKKRCFKALGFDEYIDSYGDGLQILRYNVSKAYNSHLDYIEDKSGELEHDFDSSGTGGNRFATILLYMSDLGETEGGETVFPKGWPPEVPVSERKDVKTAIQELRASEQGDILAHGSWEETLVANCRTKLATRPHSSRAVLFYSQYPNGQVDPASLHGACPVLSGQKYAANLWVWNTPRQGYPGAPIKEKFRNAQGATSSAPSANYKRIVATFQNSGQDPQMKNAQLYFEDQFWANLGLKDGPRVNTFRDHTWNIRVDGKVVKTFVVKEEDGVEQTFII